MEYGYFIDFLDVRQRVQKSDLGIIGRARTWREDLLTGELTSGRLHALTYEGSDTTSLQISADDQYITVSGNPSRFNRVDNLFGFKTFDECIEVYNQVLRRLGLPEFTKTTKFQHVDYNPADNNRNLMVGNGAEITRVDWTKNYEVGRDNEKTLLAAVSTQTLPAKMPYLYPNGETVVFTHINNHGETGSRSIYHKIYRKSRDFDRFRSSRYKYGKLNEVSRAYFDKLHSYVIERGIIREEKEFKRVWLHKHNQNWYGLSDELKFNPYLGEINKIMKHLTVSKSDFNTIESQLIENNICTPVQALATVEKFLNWTLGKDMPRTSSWYVHRKRLKMIGYDIAIQLDITRKLPKNPLAGMNITLRDCSPPDWYKLPDKRMN